MLQGFAWLIGKTKMKILIYGVNYAPELTGIGKYTGEMAEWLAEQLLDVIRESE